MDLTAERATPLSTLLRRHRIDRDLTLEALSYESGVSDRTIGDIERGVSVRPQRRTMIALADALALDGAAREAFLAAARASRRSALEPDDGDAHRPHWLDDFTGRGAEVDAVVDLLAGDAGPPVLISGAPGVGKTSLAVEAVRRFIAASPSDGGRSEGVELFLDLGSTTLRPLAPLRVLHGLLRQVAPDRPLPTTVATASAQWQEATSEHPVIVILDDAASEAQVRPVLSIGRASRVVVTSRRGLPGLESARHVAISPLSRAESVAFLERAIPPRQRDGADLDRLAALCSDLPLALRVAAGRITAQTSRSAEEFSQRLLVEDRRLGLLVAGDLAVERAFAASCHLLAPRPRALFQNLGLLRGTSFGPDLGAAIGGLEPVETEDLLDELVDLGLVEALSGNRYRIHDLLRLYAEDRLRAEVAPEVIDERMLRLNGWLLSTAARAGAMFAPGPTPDALPAFSPLVIFADQREARAWLTEEVGYWYPALQEAAAAGRHDEVLAAVEGITWFGDRWLEWGRWHEFFELAVASAVGLGDADVESEHLSNLAFMEIFELFDDERALVTAGRALDAAERAGSDKWRAWALNNLATASVGLDRTEMGIAYARESAELFERLGDLEGELQPRLVLANALRHLDVDAAVLEIRRVLAITEDASAPLSDNFRFITRAQALGTLARIFLAEARFREAVDISDELERHAGEDESTRARALRHRGFAYVGLGESERARVDLEAAIVAAGPHRPDDWAADIAQALRTL